MYVHVIIIINNTGVKQHVKQAFMNEFFFFITLAKPGLLVLIGIFKLVCWLVLRRFWALLGLRLNLYFELDYNSLR